MTASNLVRLTCDCALVSGSGATEVTVPCGRTWTSQVHDRAIAAARVEAAQEGWTRGPRLGRSRHACDVCPDCSARIEAQRQRQAEHIRAAQRAGAR